MYWSSLVLGLVELSGVEWRGVVCSMVLYGVGVFVLTTYHSLLTAYIRGRAVMRVIT